MIYVIGDITLISDIDFDRVTELRYIVEANKHAVLNIKASLKPTDAHINNCFGRFIDVMGSGELLFKGLITEYTIHQFLDYQTIEITCHSSTILMDRREKRRSFQNINMQYSELFDILCSEYSGSFIIHSDFGNTALPYIQYDETDWLFMMRLASRKYKALIPDVRYKTPHTHVGFPKSRDHVNVENAFIIMKDNKTGKTTLRFKGMKSYSIGSEFIFQNIPFTITKIYCELINFVLIFHYEATKTQDIYFEPLFNDILKGVAIKGKVLETTKELVKLHLEIDEYQDVGTAFYYQFAPDSVTQFYNMPEMNETCILYIHSSDESDCSIKYTIDGRFTTKTPHMDHKQYLNPFYKFGSSNQNHIHLSSNSKDSPNFHLVDESGVRFQTKNNIIIKNGQKIKLQASKKVYLICKSVINLEHDEFPTLVMDKDITFNSHNPTAKSYEQGTYKSAEESMSDFQQEQEQNKMINGLSALLTPPIVSNPVRAFQNAEMGMTLIVSAGTPSVSGNSLSVREVKKVKLKDNA